MKLGGLQKMTLLDFPGKVACTVFTSGCNFRCPFCHNTPLVTGGAADLDPEAFFRFLEKRRGLLDGVAITGGEPLLQNGIEDFIRRIRDLGYAVKLDTNGAYPDRLARLLEEGLPAYVAMDVKNSKEKYEQTAGVKGILPAVEQSVALLKQGKVPFEFRTTVVNELHEPADFDAIGQWLQGTERYFLQGFSDSGNILAGGMSATSPEKMRACLETVKHWLPGAMLRGVD